MPPAALKGSCGQWPPHPPSRDGDGGGCDGRQRAPRGWRARHLPLASLPPRRAASVRGGAGGSSRRAGGRGLSEEALARRWDSSLSALPAAATSPSSAAFSCLPGCRRRPSAARRASPPPLFPVSLSSFSPPPLSFSLLLFALALWCLSLKPPHDQQRDFTSSLRVERERGKGGGEEGRERKRSPNTHLPVPPRTSASPHPASVSVSTPRPEETLQTAGRCATTAVLTFLLRLPAAPRRRALSASRGSHRPVGVGGREVGGGGGSVCQCGRLLAGRSHIS